MGEVRIRKDRRLRLFVSLFVLSLCVYLLTAGGHLYGRDGVTLFLMTDSIARLGSLSIPQTINSLGGKTAENGLYYSPFGVGQPLLAVPLYLVGSWITKNTTYRYAVSCAVSLFNSFMTAISVGILGLIVLRLGYGCLAAVRVSLAFGFLTIAWPYARYFYTEPLVTTCQLIALLLLIDSEREEKKLIILTAGLALGWAIVTRPVSVLFIPPFVLLAVLLWRKLPSRELIIRILLLIFPILIAVTWVAMYNWWRYGSMVDLGYGPLPTGVEQGFTESQLRGLFIFLLSPGKSIILFSPILLLAIPQWWRFSSKHPAVAACVALTSLLYLLIFSRWCQLEGGYSWGPRFLVPIVPLLLLPLAERTSGLSRAWRFASLIVIGLVLISITVQVLGIAVNFSEVIEENPAAYYEPTTGRYRVAFSPLPRHLGLLVEMIRGVKKVQHAHYLPRDQRKELLVINLAWTDHPDLWPLNLYHDGVSKRGIGIVVLILAGGAGLSAVSLRKQLFEMDAQ